MRLSLADKMLLLPSSGNGGGGVGGGSGGQHGDPRRTYLEAVLQESLVQQNYTIVLPSHLGVSSSLPSMNGDQLSSSTAGGGAASSVLGAATLEGKAWNLAGSKGGSAAAVAAAVAAAAAANELERLQGLFAPRDAAAFGRNSANGSGSEERDGGKDGPTNLSTNKNVLLGTNGSNSCSSSTSSLSKRNGKEGYSCQVCRKVFTSSSNLAVHSMIHSGTKPFKCDLCSWSFRQKAHLQKHMRHIHKIIVAK